MNSDERKRARLVAFEDQESGAREGWVWLTFRTEDGLALGAAIVRGRGPVSAMREAMRLNCAISPHVTATMLPTQVSPHATNVNRPLSSSDLKRLAAAWEIPLSPDSWPT